MNYNYLLILVVLALSGLIYYKYKESFSNYHLAQPTKCFSCEAQLPPNMKYLGGPTKCFSCEADLRRRYGSKYTDLGGNTKCFSCEKQMGPTLGGTTKCFSCEKQMTEQSDPYIYYRGSGSSYPM